MTTKTIWYEQRCFHLCTDADRTVVCDPLAGEGVEFAEAMAKHGWEDDPTCDNSSGFVYLRRPIDAHTENYDGSQFFDRLKRVERGDLEKLVKLDGRANAAVAVMEALERYNDETRNRIAKLGQTVDALAQGREIEGSAMAALEERVDDLDKTLDRVMKAFDGIAAYLPGRTDMPDPTLLETLNRILKPEQTEQTADVEVADPALLKATVASLSALQGKYTHLNEVYASFRQELDQAVDEQTEVGLRHMDEFKTAIRSAKATSEHRDREVTVLQRENGVLLAALKDLKKKLDEEEFQRKMLDTRVSGLDVVVAEKIAGAEGGVVKAMETAMPGTRWKVEIEGGKR